MSLALGALNSNLLYFLPRKICALPLIISSQTFFYFFSTLLKPATWSDFSDLTDVLIKHIRLFNGLKQRPSNISMCVLLVSRKCSQLPPCFLRHSNCQPRTLFPLRQWKMDRSNQILYQRMAPSLWITRWGDLTSVLAIRYLWALCKAHICLQVKAL